MGHFTKKLERKKSHSNTMKKKSMLNKTNVYTTLVHIISFCIDFVVRDCVLFDCNHLLGI